MAQRSKNGCLPCKRLRIKCDESKPRCEYCRHRNRECCYPSPIVRPEITKRGNLEKKRIPKKRRKNFNVPSSMWETILIQRDPEVPYQISSPDFERLFTMEDSRAFDQFLYNETIFAPNLQLSMTKFEYRLLDFFHTFCIQRFCIGGTPEVETIWRDHVPTLFLNSRLIRCCVFSFAALLILPRCDLDQLSSENTSLAKINYLDSNSSECTIFDPCLSSRQNILNLHEKTIAYFLEAAKLTSEVIGDDSALRVSNLQSHASEMAISSMLIFAFLLSNPNYFIPLISWDRSEADFISMAKGIMFSVRQCAPILMKSEFGGLFVGKKSSNVLPDNRTFRLIRKLEDDFSTEYPVVHDFSAQSLLERETILTFLHQMKMLFHRLAGFTSPNMGFRWGMIFISDELQQLIYAKNFFALRIVFVYAAVVLFRQYEWVGTDNMWISFMRMYKQYNFEHFGDWKYISDERLFSFAHDQRLRFKTPDLISTFDPEAPDCEEMLTAMSSH